MKEAINDNQILTRCSTMFAYMYIIIIKTSNQFFREKPMSPLYEKLYTKSFENRSMSHVTLQTVSRSTICNPALCVKVMNQHNKFEDSSLILSHDIVWKHSSLGNRWMAHVTLNSGSSSSINNTVLPLIKVVNSGSMFEDSRFIFFRIMNRNLQAFEIGQRPLWPWKVGQSKQSTIP